MQTTSPSSSVVIESSNSNRRHWSEGIRELVLSLSSPTTTTNSISPFEITGGSENASFLLITNPRSERLTYLRGEERLTEGEVLLELRGERVAGRTSYDVRRALDDVRRNGGGPVSLKTVKPGFLQSSDLRAYLNLRFPKGSLDHDLQNTIRENVYSKTVPCTTRERREGELDGQEYRFISKAEFEALETSGQLLESGIYEGNYYGTPKPAVAQSSEADRSHQNQVRPLVEPLEPLLEPAAGRVEGGESSRDIICWTTAGGNRPPPPPPSDQGHNQRHRQEDQEEGEGGRERSCSIMAPLFMTDANNKNDPSNNNNVMNNNNNNNSISEGLADRLAASTSLVVDQQQHSSTTLQHNNTLHYNNNNNNGPTTTTDEELLEEDGLGGGPMPLNWEIGYTESGEKYFIDHNRGITQWTDPRLDRRSPQQQPLISAAGENTDSAAAISIGEELLPAGWDRVEDPQYGVYYVDHVNKVTQYEKPTFPQQPDNGTILRRQYAKRTSSAGGPRRVNSSNDLLVVAKCAQSPHKGLFTLNPRELRGEMISTSLVKGPKGLGFTLVGNDGNTTDDEFLQIRNIIAHGPAHKDGLLRTDCARNKRNDDADHGDGYLDLGLRDDDFDASSGTLERLIHALLVDAPKPTKDQLLGLLDACLVGFSHLEILREVLHFVLYSRHTWQTEWRSDSRSRQFFDAVLCLVTIWQQRWSAPFQQPEMKQGLHLLIDICWSFVDESPLSREERAPKTEQGRMWLQRTERSLPGNSCPKTMTIDPPTSTVAQEGARSAPGSPEIEYSVVDHGAHIAPESGAGTTTVTVADHSTPSEQPNAIYEFYRQHRQVFSSELRKFQRDKHPNQEQYRAFIAAWRQRMGDATLEMTTDDRAHFLSLINTYASTRECQQMTEEYYTRRQRYQTARRQVQQLRRFGEVRYGPRVHPEQIEVVEGIPVRSFRRSNP